MEAEAGVRQLGTKRPIVVNLAIENDYGSLARVPHRLVPRRGQVDDGKAAVGERYASFGIAIRALVVWAAMGNRAAHLVEQASVEVTEKAGYPAH